MTSGLLSIRFAFFEEDPLAVHFHRQTVLPRSVGQAVFGENVALAVSFWQFVRVGFGAAGNVLFGDCALDGIAGGDIEGVMYLQGRRPGYFGAGKQDRRPCQKDQQGDGCKTPKDFSQFGHRSLLSQSEEKDRVEQNWREAQNTPATMGMMAIRENTARATTIKATSLIRSRIQASPFKRMGSL